MRVLPILFNSDMVRAILDERKTCTRRVVKPQPKARLAYACMGYRHGTWAYPGSDARKSWGESYRMPDGLSHEELERHWNPPCHTDDILYVRETFCGWYLPGFDVEYVYKASNPSGNRAPTGSGPDDEWDIRPWCPSIHMPKEAARIFLRVTNVRVERLQGITDDQALLEGVPADGDYPLDNPVYCPVCKGQGLIGAVHPASLGYMEVECPYCDTPVKRFAHLWDSTIKSADRDRYGWDANPWVWVIEFERVGKEAALEARTEDKG